ncbi:hypothetical protein OUO_1539 [Helicobacter pylori R046Wa]|nr:hypothetical protein OUO_1539 [Helicobacter pylori R046Wa]
MQKAFQNQLASHQRMRSISKHALSLSNKPIQCHYSVKYP